MNNPSTESIIKKIDEIASDVSSIAEVLLSTDLPSSHNLRMVVLRLGVLRKAVEELNKGEK